MREIKYKYWDFEDEHMSIMSENGVFDNAYKSESTHVWQHCSLGLLIQRHNKRKGVLRQYTGLKDKNGVDVYESDIVKYRHTEWNAGGMGDKFKNAVVEFKDGSFTKFNECEVIGNIYESNHLLNKELLDE